MADKYFSTPQVAKMLGISRIAVFKQIKTGSLPAIKAGRSYLIAKSDLLGLYKKRLDKELRLHKKENKAKNEDKENSVKISKSNQIPKKIRPLRLD